MCIYARSAYQTEKAQPQPIRNHRTNFLVVMQNPSRRASLEDLRI